MKPATRNSNKQSHPMSRDRRAEINTSVIPTRYSGYNIISPDKEYPVMIPPMIDRMIDSIIVSPSLLPTLHQSRMDTNLEERIHP